jgi:hypothetical protein
MSRAMSGAMPKSARACARGVDILTPCAHARADLGPPRRVFASLRHGTLGSSFPYSHVKEQLANPYRVCVGRVLGFRPFPGRQPRRGGQGWPPRSPRRRPPRSTWGWPPRNVPQTLNDCRRLSTGPRPASPTDGQYYTMILGVIRKILSIENYVTRNSMASRV